MTNNTTQIYEEYLKYTAAWTDLSGQKFLACLQICVDFFNSRDISSYQKKFYKELQNEVINGTNISPESARKAIRPTYTPLIMVSAGMYFFKTLYN